MPTEFEQCVNWRNHVTLTCPSIEEMSTIVERLQTDDADWTDLQTKSAAWMDALMSALASFMDEEAFKSTVLRVTRFFYAETMRAGDGYRDSTQNLVNQQPKSAAEQDAFCHALIAGAFRAVFEGLNAVSMTWLGDYHHLDESQPSGWQRHQAR